jgi:23S rRNA pseudouridine2605 synthase
MRLQHYLAIAGVASRRHGEKMMAEGRVAVNGQIVKKLGTTVDPESDVVEVDGERVESEKKVYALLNKPPGYLSAVTDARGGRTVSELTADLPARLYPVGRLDKDTEGVLLMTNDGELCHKLTHPSFGIDKIYHAEVEGRPSRPALKKLQKGVEIGDGRTRPAGVKLLGVRGNRSTLEITIHEGKKRQVKKMCERVGHPVTTLSRIEFGGIRLGNLKRGEHRLLSDAEVAKLRRLVMPDPKTKGQNRKPKKASKKASKKAPKKASKKAPRQGPAKKFSK